MGKLYQEYHTHGPTADDSSWRSTVPSLFRAIREVAFGYPPTTSLITRMLASLLACISPLRDLGGATVLWLRYRPIGGRLLDVGCGAGTLLQELSAHGWEVVGIDADPKAAARAAEGSRFPIRCSPLADGLFEPQSFDAITLNHVLEHLADPVVALRICGRYLKAGGMLVILTPNLNSLSRGFFGRYWRGWETPRHLTLFSKKSLRECAVRAGLVPTALWTTARYAPNLWSSSWRLRRCSDSVAEGRGGGGLWMRAAALLFGVFEHALNLFTGCGEEVALVATRRVDS